MIRFALTGLLAASLVCTATLPDSPAQEKQKKQKKQKAKKISIADPKEAAKDPDFAIQGEYVGEVTVGAETLKAGVQLVARGDGKFVGRAYYGGLPGAGWDGNSFVEGTAQRTGENTATLKDMDGAVVGDLKDKVITLKNGATGTLKKVDRKSDTLGKKPPEGAIVLFGGPDDVDKWNGGKITELSDGKFLGVGVRSKETFNGFTAHIEFRTPWMPNSTGQARGNSGVYIQDRYECQVLDSFGLEGKDNECGGIYQQFSPKPNMCLPPLSWQTYDIEFTPAVYDADGKKTKNARATIYHNGVKIHDDIEFKSETPGSKKEGPMPGALYFQDHGNPVVFRNVWVLPTR